MDVVRAAKKGGEVFSTYGKLSSAALLLRYGFVDRENPHDFVVFTESVLMKAAEREASHKKKTSQADSKKSHGLQKKQSLKADSRGYHGKRRPKGTGYGEIGKSKTAEGRHYSDDGEGEEEMESSREKGECTQEISSEIARAKRKQWGLQRRMELCKSLGLLADPSEGSTEMHVEVSLRNAC